MSISRFFIDRPVATTLLTLGLTLAGAVAFRLLPVSPLPQVDIPTISISARLPGASPETMAATVATPLERQLGRIAGVNEITSSSALGSTRITLQFDMSRDINGAANDVQAALNAARAQLPTGLPGNPTYRKVNPADAPLIILALTSDSLSQGQMYDIASTVLAQKLSQVEGIGQVTVGGSSLPAVRVALNPTALNRYGIGLSEVRTALANANANRPKGLLEEGERQWQIGASDQAKKAKDYLPLIVAWRNGAAVRLPDVGEVKDSVEDLRNAGSTNGKPSVLLFLNRQPGANIVATADRVLALLPMLRATLPDSVTLSVQAERTAMIRASMHDVERTLAISVGLVIMVVFLFLRNWRATLIPAIAVPVSLIGTFTVMYLAGYSLDNLSLMALIIATGFVVDDAIVVLENVSRYLEQGLSPRQAALKGAREVAFTVLSMSLSLVAVFIPILMMGGIVGRFFREFAVTLSVAIAVSLLVSLTTTPMMCARLLRPQQPGGAKPAGRFGACARWGDALYHGLLGGYERSLRWALRHSRLMMVLLAATIGLNFYLYAAIPKGFIPDQDSGRLSGFIQADQSISFQAMREKLDTFMEIVRSDPAVASVSGFTGGGQRNGGQLFISLKPVAERGMTSDQWIDRIRPRLLRVPGAYLFLSVQQDVRVGGRQSNARYEYSLQSDDLQLLRTWSERLRKAMALKPELEDVNSDQQDRGLQTSLVIDRDAATRLGLSIRQIDAALYDAFGQRQVSTIYEPLNQYHVVMELEPRYLQNPEALKELYVKNDAGQMVPFAAFARYEPTLTPLSVNHQGQFAATTISFNLPPGKALSDAVRIINDTANEIGMPSTVQGGFQSGAKAFQDSLKSQPWLILAALITVYIVLGVLYESYVHPLTIISTLPSAGVGALLALLVCDTEFTIIALIGVILLIGIVKKNAIMMIDFALAAERNDNLTPEEAIFRACLLRFRPIMMTTLAAMLGALPLALGAGDGAELRRPLGIAVVGGLLVSQALTLYTTPVVYLYLDRFRLWCRRLAHKDENQQLPAIAES